jgi:MoaA/NifB/PqqE/SkfB family radical SAM enzyme
MFMYLQNLSKLTRGDFTLSPRLAVYYVTMQCNLNCTYCEDFGSRCNHLVTPTLENAKKILKVIRTGVDRLWITGCEPLMVPHLMDLLDYARKDLDFREISLITWAEAWTIAREKYGEAPTSCVSCFQQCYAEPSFASV